MKLAYFFTLIIVLMCGKESAFAQTLPRTPTGNWVISETNSPVDYTPVVVAVARSLAKDEPSALELSISCRNGRANLILTGRRNVPRVRHGVARDPKHGGKISV
jgi:hypothetical protein